MGHPNGSAGKDDLLPNLLLSFPDPRGKRRELAAESCALTSTWALWYVFTHRYT